jgi:hypothetical protein
MTRLARRRSGPRALGTVYICGDCLMWKRAARVVTGVLCLAYDCHARASDRPAAVEKPAGPIKACSLEARPGILIDVRDSLRHAPLSEATLRILSARHVVDSARSFAGRRAVTLLGGVRERPGVYDVIVRRSGYGAWRRDSVRVLQGECHVVTVRIVANMNARH